MYSYRKKTVFNIQNFLLYLIYFFISFYYYLQETQSTSAREMGGNRPITFVAM
jgi:hypothetical protein